MSKPVNYVQPDVELRST